MMFKDYIPIGKENKKTRQQIMHDAKIFDEKEFKRELTDLRTKEIVIFDNGYYIPNKKEEIQDFIKNCNEVNIETNKIIALAYKKIDELEELENGKL